MNVLIYKAAVEVTLAFSFSPLSAQVGEDPVEPDPLVGICFLYDVIGKR